MFFILMYTAIIQKIKKYINAEINKFNNGNQKNIYGNYSIINQNKQKAPGAGGLGVS